MERRINWLHFSDLHYGQKKQKYQMPKLKKELFRDLEQLTNQIGSWDVVFFTGDLTFSGKKEEFDELNQFLSELWDLFKKIGSNPYLIAIPGNHDLTRQDPTKAAVKVLKNYHEDADIQELLWNNLDSSSEYHELIKNCFANFEGWYNELKLPKPEITKGLLPGDISTILELNGIKLGCIGLNTAFLELTSDNYKGKLAMHSKQVQQIANGDSFEWIKNVDIPLLLTHHDPSWLDENSLELYESEINPPGTFFNHFCGHLHAPISFEKGLTGSKNKRIQLAPSLFGTEMINSQLHRIFGFNCGSYEIIEKDVIERFYPRILLKQYDGNYRIGPDFGFDLNSNNCCVSQYSDFVRIEPTSSDELDIETAVDSSPEISDKSNILDLEEDDSSLKSLENLPQGTYINTSYHSSVRLVEQEKFVENILNQRFTWLITDWGLNENEFIATTLSKIGISNHHYTFILNCEDIVDRDELLQAFESQFNITLQRFCNLVSKLDKCLLIFNHVNKSAFETPSSYSKINRLITSIIDYSQSINLIIVSRQAPASIQDEITVRLTPLDIPQTKIYIQNHPNLTEDLLNVDTIERIHKLSSGLPKHIDRVLEKLRITTLEELIEDEIETSKNPEEIDLVPKSLIQAISSLTESKDRYKGRSYLLLKILTVLANGETLSNVKRLIPNEPLYAENASELEQLSLLEVITINRLISDISPKADKQIKILRVPRQVRDIINSQITDNERENILKSACTTYFGNKWREGTIKKINFSPLKMDNNYLNVENCQLILTKLLHSAIHFEQEIEVERCLNLCVSYCQLVYDLNDFKNSERLCDEIYHLLKSFDFSRQKALIMKLYGESLRMNGNKDKAINILNEAMEQDPDIFSNEEKMSIYTKLALTYLLVEESEKSIEYAKRVEKLSSEDSYERLNAAYILAQNNLEGDALLKKLRTLENKMRKMDQPYMANSIALRISTETEDIEEKHKYLNRVLQTKGDEYNVVRAIVSKALDHLDGKVQGEFSKSDLLLLNLTYSYLYNQRLYNIFKNCHQALWKYCLLNNLYADLINLFKHSSFFWRISDKENLEKEYLTELSNLQPLLDEKIPSNNINKLNMEYFKRRKSEMMMAT